MVNRLFYTSLDSRKITHQGETAVAALLRFFTPRSDDPSRPNHVARGEQFEQMLLKRQEKWVRDKNLNPVFVIRAESWPEAVGQPVMTGWPPGRVHCTDDDYAAMTLVGWLQRGSRGFYVATERMDDVVEDGVTMVIRRRIEDGKEIVRRIPT